MFMGGHDLTVSTAENYRAWGREAAGRSPQYERLAHEVAGDGAVLGYLSGLPPAKRQPNLLFAAARYLLGAPADLQSLRALIAGRESELRAVMLARRTPRSAAPTPDVREIGADRAPSAVADQEAER